LGFVLSEVLFMGIKSLCPPKQNYGLVITNLQAKNRPSMFDGKMFDGNRFGF
jgi:hypothetical protein